MSTISLHNIRYELLQFGDELWRDEDGQRELVGIVSKTADWRQWEVWCEGRIEGPLKDQETARQVLQGHFVRLVEQS